MLSKMEVFMLSRLKTSARVSRRPDRTGDIPCRIGAEDHCRADSTGRSWGGEEVGVALRWQEGCSPGLRAGPLAQLLFPSHHQEDAGDLESTCRMA